MNSWPIEIGMAWINGDKVESWSSLIQPDPTWQLDDWSIASARVHKIPKDMIMSAPTARDVAEIALVTISGKHLVSDNPAFERFWMNKLLSTADASSPMFFNYELIAASACQNNPFAIDHLFNIFAHLKEGDFSGGLPPS